MKKITDIYNSRKQGDAVFSFEFFPPKSSEGDSILFNTIEDIQELNPSFVSVTYGAGGSTQGKTQRWVQDIQDKYNITSMAHFTCIGAGRSEIQKAVEGFAQAGVKNIMALRGDLPKDQPNYQPPADGFSYANELIAFIKTLGLDLSIGAACYPEKHQDAKSIDEDIRYLKQKVDFGAEFLISQLFFDNAVYFDFLEKCNARGILVPVIPGIMPITSFSQIERFASMAACKIPHRLVEKLSRVKDDHEELLKISLDYSVGQCQDLLDHGVPGLHFYTLNRSGATKKIMKALSEMKV